MTLPASPMPVDDETLISQMLRVTEANGLPSVGQLYRRIKKPTGVPMSELLHGPSDEWIQSAEQTTGIDGAHLMAGTRRGGRYPSLRTWSPVRDPRITVHCPACLADDGAWRLMWLLPYATVCPRHRLVLVDHRRSCADRRGLHRRWMAAAGSTQLCIAERCRFPRGRFPVKSATTGDLDKQDQLLKLDLEGNLRLRKAPYLDVDPDTEPPQIYERQTIRSRPERGPGTHIEFLNRPL